MLDPLIAQLAQAGLLGAIALGALFVAYQKDKRVQELQEKRVTDAQKYAEGLQQAVGLIEDNTEALERLAAQKEAPPYARAPTTPVRTRG